jgi:hypothetical protein
VARHPQYVGRCGRSCAHWGASRDAAPAGTRDARGRRALAQWIARETDRRRLTSFNAAWTRRGDGASATSRGTGTAGRLLLGTGLDGWPPPRRAPRTSGAAGAGALLVSPGIRRAGAAADDQRRIATPAEAVRAGSDLLVVGRPVSGAKDPAAEVRAIRREMAGAVS